MEPVDLPEDIIVLKGKGPSVKEIDEARAREKERMRSGAVETPDIDPIEFMDMMFGGGLLAGLTKEAVEAAGRALGRKAAVKALGQKAAGKQVLFSTPDPKDLALIQDDNAWKSYLRKNIEKSTSGSGLTRQEQEEFDRLMELRDKFSSAGKKPVKPLTDEEMADRISKMSDEEFRAFMELRDKGIEEAAKKDIKFSNPNPFDIGKKSIEEKNRDALVKVIESLQAKKEPPTPAEMAKEFLEAQAGKAAREAKEAARVEELQKTTESIANTLQEGAKRLGIPTGKENLVKGFADKMKASERSRSQIQAAKEQVMRKKDLTPAMRRSQMQKLERQEKMISDEISQLRSQIVRQGGQDLLREILRSK